MSNRRLRVSGRVIARRRGRQFAKLLADRGWRPRYHDSTVRPNGTISMGPASADSVLLWPCEQGRDKALAKRQVHDLSLRSMRLEQDRGRPVILSVTVQWAGVRLTEHVQMFESTGAVLPHHGPRQSVSDLRMELKVWRCQAWYFPRRAAKDRVMKVRELMSSNDTAERLRPVVASFSASNGLTICQDGPDRCVVRHFFITFGGPSYLFPC